MLSVGELLPHFEATTVTGERFMYSRVWQRRNLVLVVLPSDDEAAGVAYDTQLRDQMVPFCAADTACIVTLDRVSGLPGRAVAIADQWGEIAYLAPVDDSSRLPLPSDLLEWVRSLQRRCPECEGETK